MALSDQESLNDVAERAEQYLHKLSKTVSEGRKPPPGPYAFFNHNAHALERLKNCRRCLDRLFEGRRRLTELANEEKRLKPGGWPPGVPYPDEIQAVMREESRVTGSMHHDLESLYMFGGILLD